MDTTETFSFPPEVALGLQEAIDRLRDKIDAVYGDSTEIDRMADFHYLAHELVDQQMSELAEGDPSLERGALLDLREQIGRYVHRLVEKSRHFG